MSLIEPLRDHIEAMVAAAGASVARVAVAAVPIPDTPVAFSVGWLARGDLLGEDDGRKVIGLVAPLPVSCFTVEARWLDERELLSATLDAAWRLGAARMRQEIHAKGQAREELAKIFPAGGAHSEWRMSMDDTGDRLLTLARRVGYVVCEFRPVWRSFRLPYADDPSLETDGSRLGACPRHPVLPGTAPNPCDYHLAPGA